MHGYIKNQLTKSRFPLGILGGSWGYAAGILGLSWRYPVVPQGVPPGSPPGWPLQDPPRNDGLVTHLNASDRTSGSVTAAMAC